jgi:aspartate racemase
MKTIGMIGGIGPESTVAYYRQIVACYREQHEEDSSPPLIINSIDLQKLVAMMTANALPQVTAYLAEELERLARVGAECGLIAANTPHVVFDQLSGRSPIPLVSIVEATCSVAEEVKLTRLGLLGTRFTMEGEFYQRVFARNGIAVVVPEPADRAYTSRIHARAIVAHAML